MKSTNEKLEASKVSQIIKNWTADCIEGCSGWWLECAKEVILLNGIDIFQFVTSMKDLLIHGRGKKRNLIIIGPANCSKIYMLKSLKLIFSDSMLENPTNTTIFCKISIF